MLVCKSSTRNGITRTTRVHWMRLEGMLMDTAVIVCKIHENYNTVFSFGNNTIYQFLLALILNNKGKRILNFSLCRHSFKT
jgi:hypothetical protein